MLLFSMCQPLKCETRVILVIWYCANIDGKIFDYSFNKGNLMHYDSVTFVLAWHKFICEIFDAE